MAGHLLATVNPEAAAAIEQEPSAARAELRPPVGTMVRFYPRPHEGRGGRAEFAMMVTEHLNDGRVAGVAIFDANDFRDVMGVWRRTESNPYPSWDWLPRHHEISEVEREFADSVAQRVTELEREMEVLAKRPPPPLVVTPELAQEISNMIVADANSEGARVKITEVEKANDVIQDAVLALGERLRTVEKELGLGEFKRK